MSGWYDASHVALETSVAFYLTKARQVLFDRLDQALEPLGLTAQQIGVVLLVARGYARTPLELSRKLSYDTGSMTRMLDRLEKKGFIERRRSATDRRVIELALTEHGARAAQALPAVIAEQLNAQLAGFSADEVASLMSLLRRFIANSPGADTSRPCGAPDAPASH